MNTKKKAHFLFRAAGFTVFSLFFGSCIKSTSATSTTTTYATYISVLNLAPYTPPVDILFNGSSATLNVQPDTYFSSYSQVNPGSYDVKFVKSGGDSLVAEIPAYTYDSLSFYTLMVYNIGHDSAKAVTIPDNFSNVTNVYSYYRFYNMNPDLGGVDLYLNGNLAQSNRTPADNVKTTTYNYFQELQPGYFTVLIKAAGTDSLITSATSVDLSVGNVYTFMLTGKGSASTFNVLRGTY